MRDFSKVSPSIWRSKKFKSLGADMEAKHVYLYLLTCPHGNSAGCFDLPPLYASNDLGMTAEAYSKAIDSLSKADLIEWDEAEQTLLIVNWDEFNEPTNPKHAIGLLSQLEQAASKTLKTKCFHSFLARFRAKKFDTDSSLRKAIEIFLEAYPKPIATEIETKMEIETERRPRGEETETETRGSPREALRLASQAGSQAPLEDSETPPPIRSPNGPSQKLIQAAHKIGAVQ